MISRGSLSWGGVITIGAALEARVSEWFAEGKSVEAFVLDAAGSAAIMNVFTQVSAELCEEVTRRGWQTGMALRPGQHYWDIAGQESIFEVVPGERISVELLDSFFMRPQKSQTAVIPMGPEMKEHADPDKSYCRHCQAKRCPMRREPQVAAIT